MVLLKNKGNIIFAVLSIIVLIALAILSFYTSDGFKDNDSYNDSDLDLYSRAVRDSNNVTDIKQMYSIDVNQYLSYYSGSENKLILVGNDGCGYCKIARPIIQGIMYENDFDIYYLNTDDFTTESEDLFMSSNEQLSSFATPLLMVVSNGEIVDSIEGLYDKDGYVDFFTKNNFINSEGE